ncbi:MAG: signal peptide peptidase SppA [archaeon]|nr:signal peptide peptidase SppA [archaeon]
MSLMGLNNDSAKKLALIGGIGVLLLVFLVLLGVALVLGLEGISLEKKVAVIPLQGEIASSSSGFSETYSASEIVGLLDEAGDDPLVGVIFIDIDSPGGSVVPTKQIVYKVREVREKKPVVAYIGEMGASGGYYVASATDYVIADADSITGSIGVLTVVPDVSGLLEKLGVKVNVLRAGELKATANIFEELTEKDRQILESLLEETFQQFKGDVLSFRKDKLLQSSFDSIADGRILSGRQALSRGLVDELASRENAIKKAAELGGIQGEPELKTYSKPAPSLIDLFSISGKIFGEGMARGLFSIQAPRVKA